MHNSLNNIVFGTLVVLKKSSGSVSDYFCQLCHSLIFEVSTIGCEVVCGLYVTSHKLHAEQYVLQLNANHVSFYLGRLSVSDYKIYLTKTKNMFAWKIISSQYRCVNVLPCIIEQLWQTIWCSNNLKSKLILPCVGLSEWTAERLHGWMSGVSMLRSSDLLQMNLSADPLMKNSVTFRVLPKSDESIFFFHEVVWNLWFTHLYNHSTRL